ncbi:MAG: hypothetical protein ACXQS4_02445 [Methermicoccaceae archaeon]
MMEKGNEIYVKGRRLSNWQKRYAVWALLRDEYGEHYLRDLHWHLATGRMSGGDIAAYLGRKIGGSGRLSEVMDDIKRAGHMELRYYTNDVVREAASKVGALTTEVR